VIALVSGVAAGFVHVLLGPDHLAAVTPLAVARPRRSARAGIVWGLGHSGGVILIAILALLLRGVLPLDTLSSWSERAVGVVLLLIGVWGLRLALSSRLHAHLHEHDGHTHAHVHLHREPHHASAAPKHRHNHAAFAVGVLHGLAGSSHFLGVLPALALPSHFDAVMYVAGFGAGSVAAMGAYGACIGALARRARSQPLRLYRTLLAGSATAAIAIGCFWLVSV
jgi:sulfite exporter TauE/SafE